MSRIPSSTHESKASVLAVGDVIPTDFGDAEIKEDYGKNAFWRYKCVTRGTKPQLVFAHPRVHIDGPAVAWDDPESLSSIPDHRGWCRPCGKPNR